MRNPRGPRIRSSVNQMSEGLALPEDSGTPDVDYEVSAAELSKERSPVAGSEEGAAGADENLVEMPDGSVMILEDEEGGGPGDFGANLAETLDVGTLGRIASTLSDSIERDKEARSKRDEQYAEGIKRTGLGNEAPGGAMFTGASKAVHPVLVEACIDFSARAMKELFPAKGPVKTHIIGKQTDDKLARAERKKTYMNWQLTKQSREYRAELEQLLTQLPLAGSQYMKVWQDPTLKRPRFAFVPIDDIYLPFSCTDFYNAPRLTHVQHLTRSEFEARVDSGQYREVPVADAGGAFPEQSASSRATDKVEGREDTGYNEDGIRDVFEVQVELELGEDDAHADKGRVAPYVVSLDQSTNTVLSIYRNWKEGDESRERLCWIVEFPLIPWRGAYAIGLGQAVGSLAGTATGALRALIDAAHIQNMPTALKLKGSRVAGQTLQLQPTGITEIEGPASIDDVRKVAMPLPFPGPSPILFELLKYCVETAKGVISTADERIAENNVNAPVGTTLALIEQGSITFSAVHARLHESQRRLLEVLHRLNAEYLSDKETIEELGELIVGRGDFEGPMDVMPVSDPNIFSDAQRYAQHQAVLQLRTMFPQSFKDNALLERTLQLLNYPSYEEVLNFPHEPEQRTPIEENIAARDPLQQLKVYPNEDDMAHLRVHLAFMSSPIFCANPMMAMPALPKLLEHCAEHLAALYGKHSNAASRAAEATGLAMGQDPEAAAAEGVVLAEQALVQMLGPLMEHLQKVLQTAQQFAPQPPQDPAIQITQMHEQAETARAEARLKAEGEKEALRAKAESERHMLTLQARSAETHGKSAAESARHTEEMSVAAQNARIAEESERRAQEFELLTSRMRDEANAARQCQQEQFTLMLESVRAENARTLEVLRQALKVGADTTAVIMQVDPGSQGV